MGLFSALKREQREAIGLLQIGTFLEYFDLMLYIHMAVLLNDLFFPPTDPHTTALLTAFTFCSTYILRPFGALFFGYIGDNIGRKPTVIITTTTMALSCIVMGSLPTYAEIGITAACIMMICRILQGFSSMGEIIGAQIYIMEILKPPLQVPMTAFVGIFARIGSTAALGIATLVTSHGFNWRIGFWIGATIALVGGIARTRLRETPEFVDMKLRIKKAIEDSQEVGLGKAAEILKCTNKSWKEKVSTKTSLAFFMTECAHAVVFYFAFIHCSMILKDTFGYSSSEIIRQNFIIAILQLVSYFLFTFLAFKVDAIKIVKVRMWVFLPFVVIFPMMMESFPSSTAFFFLQAFAATFILDSRPAMAILYQSFPVFKRFTYVGLMYASSRAIVYVITSFGLVYLTDFFGYWGSCVLLAPATISFIWAIMHFAKIRNIKHAPLKMANS